LKRTESIEQISSAIKVLRRQVVELRVFERRCRQAEAALKSFEERNRLLADSAPLGIFTTDTQGGVTGISRKMLEMLPWPSVDDQKSMNLT
jgi:PAS domain-containing protein